MIIEGNKIIASEGKIFSRIIDGFNMGEIIYLGVDYSTGNPREDKPEYYIEIDKPIEQDIETFNQGDYNAVETALGEQNINLTDY